MDKCNRLWIWHRWKYLSKAHRICEKCGTCEERFMGYWITTEFERLIKNAASSDSNKEWWRKDRKKALAYIQSFDTTMRDEK